MSDAAFQQCINPGCAARYDIRDVLSKCPTCGNLLDVTYDWNQLEVPSKLAEFESAWANRRNPLDFSGVWRFRRLLPFAPEEHLATVGEGQTLLRRNDVVARYAGLNSRELYLQYEGMNPSGSFKDNGMTGAFSHAGMVGARCCACASTGNTSASLALFAGALGNFRAVIFIGAGKVALGKLAQALEYGAVTFRIDGDFDNAMAQVQSVCTERNIYLVNSLNPFRLEGQKTIMLRILEGLGWEVPDWIIVPGGNLGNSSAFGKAFIELKHLGLIDRMPRIAIINAAGADTLYEMVEHRGMRWNEGNVDDSIIESYYDELDQSGRRASTLATAIQINVPVNLKKALRTLDATDGVVREVTDDEILDAKAEIGRHGLGCEPASAASVAGLKKLIEEGLVSRSDRVACVLTGHVLKDPTISTDYHILQQQQLADKYAGYGIRRSRLRNAPIDVPNDLGAILEQLDRVLD
ncbi:MAG: threonine synthase [Planctomycetota bacterium]